MKLTAKKLDCDEAPATKPHRDEAVPTRCVTRVKNHPSDVSLGLFAESSLG